jgi:predicted NBD/HSP70 family sugar kinase
MRNYPIVEKLKNLLNLPVILHNNCSALALGEFRYGGFETQNSMFTFLFRTGVNGSFIDNGRIFINSKRQTLEIGHLPVCKNGPKCACGRKGCLQACISALCPDETVSFMFENVDPDSDSGRKILKAAAEYMAVVIRTIEKIFAPSSFLIVACNDRIAGMLSEEIGKILDKPDTFGNDSPVIFHAAYDPLFAQKGISDQILINYFAR